MNKNFKEIGKNPESKNIPMEQFFLRSFTAMQMAGHTQNTNGAQHYNYDPSNSSNNRMRTASLSTSDEGIVMDYSDETPRKRRVSQIRFLRFFLLLCLFLILVLYEIFWVFICFYGFVTVNLFFESFTSK